MKLNRKLLESDFAFPTDVQVTRLPILPERIIQFGEGNFLRAFVDWMVHQANKQGLFNGRVVVVQPLPSGLVPQLNQQDGLYTLFLRGIQDGQVVEKKEVISSISRGINPYEDWESFLACAEKPEIRYVISNTTEAGIAYVPEEYREGVPLSSYPGKLTAYLYRRFRKFGPDPAMGMVVIPCELIDRNGDNLKSIVLQLAREWNLPAGFIEWVEKHNYFLNSLVDRIVTGYPRDQIDEITAYLGYEDALLDTGEIFHLWVIEGDVRFSEELPFHKVGLNVKWVPDMTPYRTRKVRVLNGAHTMTVPVAYLHGFDTVREAVEDELVGTYVRRGIFEEILPTLNMDAREINDFAQSVLERFQNPFIKHYWIDIALNSTSKFKTRVLPSIVEYTRIRGTAPPLLSFSLAALIAFYRGEKIEDGMLVGRRDKGIYRLRDDRESLLFFQEQWADFDGVTGSIDRLVRNVLANRSLWSMDLNEIPGLHERVARSLENIVEQGMAASVKQLLAK
ncbi:tagaturonate reductase [Desulfofundulus sp. TPOSR]|uniref:tagaturonate reductase n=1 Tax=Desulfofundulus sp. TPOSR TaxID=2714340 RepID=UPI00140AD8D3|nr:tagaturonate reductase [Desulfofundulus sp. TPOSR]NHM28331.1 tagaturonate reductase [Desulfofundulus sp. TPOSR]